MSKVAYVASTFSHIKNFHMPYINRLIQEGHEVVVIAGGNKIALEGVSRSITLPFEKKLVGFQNVQTVYALRKHFKEEVYDWISVHTTLAAALVRLSLQGLRCRPYVINTVHGYLFDDHTPLPKRVVYIGIEKYLKRYTNTLIVMNRQDEILARKYKLYRDKLVHIRGMGVDEQSFLQKATFALTRASLGFEETDKVLVFVGEYSERKNQRFLIEAMRYLPQTYKLILLGKGDTQEGCREHSEQLEASQGGIKRIYHLGHQPNIVDYYQLSDLCVSASKSEGLPFNIIEAMLVGLPVVASHVKGHEDLIDASCLFELTHPKALSEKILKMTPSIWQQQGERNRRVAQTYTLETVFEFNYEQLRGEG